MKQNIEFYPHYATSDQHAKFKMLRVEFGWAGEGKFWALNNRIAQADKCCLDVSKKYNKAALASDLDFSMEEFDKFILFLKDDCELISECEEGIITTDIVIETFDKVMKDRGEARARYRRASGEKGKTSGEKTYRVKERKGKESKVNNYTKVFEVFYIQYPVKKSKEQAFKIWQKLNREKQLPDLKILLTAVEQQSKEKELKNNAGQFYPEWKHPSTWLNQKCWEDEVDLNIKQKNEYELKFNGK